MEVAKWVLFLTVDMVILYAGYRIIKGRQDRRRSWDE